MHCDKRAVKNSFFDSSQPFFGNLSLSRIPGLSRKALQFSVKRNIIKPINNY